MGSKEYPTYQGVTPQGPQRQLDDFRQSDIKLQSKFNHKSMESMGCYEYSMNHECRTQEPQREVQQCEDNCDTGIPNPGTNSSTGKPIEVMEMPPAPPTRGPQPEVQSTAGTSSIVRKPASKEGAMLLQSSPTTDVMQIHQIQDSKMTATHNSTVSEQISRGTTSPSSTTLRDDTRRLQMALKILEDRFGRPYHVVKACIDTMTKGPPISVIDHQALQRFADEVQANYDTLASMGFLSEVNKDMLGKILSRLPRGTQNKFIEHLRKLETTGHSMPSFTDVVNFLKDRAQVANHPFFSSSSQPTTRLPIKQPVKPTHRSSTFTTTATTSKELCTKCSKDHALYKCDAFKALTPRERADFAKNNHLCFKCLSSKHSAKQCKSTARCRASGCGKLHHTLLHFERKEENSVTTPASDVPKANFCVAAKKISRGALLQVLSLRVTSLQGDTITTYGLLDSGSDLTMIDSSLALLLGMKGTLDNYFEESQYILADSAWATRDLSIPLKHVDVMKDGANCSHLQHVTFPEGERKKVSVLIGTNIHEAFIPLEVRRGSRDEPFVIRSCIGWSVLGGSCKGMPSDTSNANHVTTTDAMLQEHLQHFWRIESYGVDVLTTKPMSIEDKRAMNIVEETLHKDGNHYKMGLLWKEPKPQLPYNRPLAEARINHLKHRLQNNPQLHAKYKAVMDDYLKKGYAVLSTEEAAKISGKTWYLPHHPVSNPNKPGKIRVVFDAAAKYGGTSLNDNLLQGPCFINDLTGVLLRFREERRSREDGLYCRCGGHVLSVSVMVCRHDFWSSVFLIYFFLFGGFLDKPASLPGYGNVQRRHGEGFFATSEDQKAAEKYFLFKQFDFVSSKYICNSNTTGRILHFDDSIVITIMRHNNIQRSIVWYRPLFIITGLRRKFSKSRISYYSNSCATFNFMEFCIKLSGDVHPLPGPEITSNGNGIPVCIGNRPIKSFKAAGHVASNCVKLSKHAAHGSILSKPETWLNAASDATKLARSHGLSDSYTQQQNVTTPVSDDNLFEFRRVSNSDVRDVIMSMAPNKAPGHDRVPLRVIKDCLSSILPTLTSLINTSFTTSVFPRAWKKAEVVPHPKEGDPEVPGNNRPISLLPALSKVAEKIALNDYNSYLTKMNKLTHHQSGNRKYHSTETLGLLVTGDIYRAMDEKKLTAMILIDLSKAFDSICHNTLLFKLKNLGTSPTAIKWFASYLTDRQQSTRVGTSLSDQLTVTHGVPQGSILGPMLFGLYMNDLPSVVKYSHVESYVDDTKIYLSFAAKDVDSCLSQVEEDLRRIAEWCCANSLLINPDKTKFIVFGTPQMLARRNFYVDEVLRSETTEERAISLAINLIKLLAFACQSSVATVASSKPSTKRGIFSVASSLFDLLGFLAPLILPVKILLQDLWRIGVSWDKEVPEQFLTQWKEWIHGIPHVVNINIPRCFKPQGFGSPSCTQLHVFSDASRRGLAVVAYLRMLIPVQYHQRNATSCILKQPLTELALA
ncbi:putative RNA-directed DNA polymerase from transposon BS [Exaiptasia diaphana]|nr:putative RNA-directed DNA polymerase from transposon BS [Exaiptasia diaphana]